MAHEFESGVYAKRPAWHGLGKVWDRLLTIKEAIVASGVGFSVDDGTLYIKNEVTGAFEPVDGWKAIVREDTRDVVGIHGEDYQRDNFADHFNALGFENQEVVESMVLLRKGRIAVCTIKLPDLDRILPDGSHYTNLISAYSSHDGTYAMSYKDVSYRTECANMLRAADADKNPRLRAQRILHRGGKDEARRNAVNVMTYAQARADYTEAEAIRLLKVKLTSSQIDRIFQQLVPVPKEEGRGRTIAINKIAAIKDIYKNAPDQQNIRGTAWGFAQAVANFTDHRATYRASDTSTPEARETSRAENQFISTVLKGNTLADQVLELVAAR